MRVAVVEWSITIVRVNIGGVYLSNLGLGNLSNTGGRIGNLGNIRKSGGPLGHLGYLLGGKDRWLLKGKGTIYTVYYLSGERGVVLLRNTPGFYKRP